MEKFAGFSVEYESFIGEKYEDDDYLGPPPNVGCSLGVIPDSSGRRTKKTKIKPKEKRCQTTNG